MKFKRNIVVYLLYTYIWPLGHVHGQRFASSSGETNGDGSHAEAHVTSKPKSSIDAMALKSLTPHLTHSGDGSKNQGPLHLCQQQHHQHPQRHLQDEPDWIQVGNTLTFEPGGGFVYSVAMLADGSRVAVGAAWEESQPDAPGSVYIFKRVDDTWEQVSNTLTFEPGGGFGYSVDMSADGSRIVVGARFYDGDRGLVHVFDEPTTGSNSSDWTQIGNDIIGEAVRDEFGWSVAISADGSCVAVGAPFNDGNGSLSGSVTIFQRVNDSWEQVGNTIIGEDDFDEFGKSVAMSADGSHVIIGAPHSHNYIITGGSTNGHAKVFGELIGSNSSAWIPIGNDIIGEAALMLFGWSVAMSADGATVAVSAQSGSRGEGIVRVFRQPTCNGSTWTQIGNDINGEAGDNWFFGWSVAMSADGRCIAVGAPLSGHVRVFAEPTTGSNSSAWIQIGNEINGEAGNIDSFGWSVDMSADGSHVVVGAPYHDGNGSHVQVFEHP